MAQRWRSVEAARSSAKRPVLPADAAHNARTPNLTLDGIATETKLISEDFRASAMDTPRSQD